MLKQRSFANDGHRFIWREVVAVVFQYKKIESRDQAISGISRDQIHLFFLQGTCQQAKVHDARRRGKSKTVGCDQTLVTIRTLHKFVTKPWPPLWGIGRRL